MNTVGVEVGNSNIKIGIFDGKNLRDVFIFPTEDIKMLEVPATLKKTEPFFTGIASVVPSINNLLKKVFASISKDIFFITPFDCGLPLKVKNPKGVGVDRVLNCKAAVNLFNSDVVVIDIGTATTVDYASQKGFMGGVIIPGPSLWRSSLATTGMIKDIKETEARIPGKDTSEAIECGIRYGLPGAIDSIVYLYKKKYPSAKVILTGGWSKRFSRYIKFDSLKRYLTLEGLGMVLYERCERLQDKI